MAPNLSLIVVDDRVYSVQWTLHVVAVSSATFTCHPYRSRQPTQLLPLALKRNVWFYQYW